jgi:putative hydrolase of HD superfamily
MARLEFEKILKFEELLHTFALVQRVAHVKGRAVRENDVEHSYFIPMLAWYLIEAFQLPLNTEKVIRYALVHDLVETYAGDTYIFDEAAQKTKHAREESARRRLGIEFPEFPSLHESISAYEAQEDAESIFVKALDKIEPFIANYLQDGRTWKEMDVSFTEIIKNKREKTKAVPEISALLEEIIAIIEARKEQYFNQE